MLEFDVGLKHQSNDLKLHSQRVDNQKSYTITRCHLHGDDDDIVQTVTAQVRDLPRMGIPLPNSDYKIYTYNVI